ncbi:MAG TPA: tetratricopeptide repeat protein, partial [Candidatus Cloacimonadota bacterium]|nr:tetratricopeptide repeat protein [Candidatus Cloacimonadota bacterium]
ANKLLNLAAEQKHGKAQHYLEKYGEFNEQTDNIRVSKSIKSMSASDRAKTLDKIKKSIEENESITKFNYFKRESILENVLKGDVKAQYRLALMYKLGRDVEKNMDYAIKLLTLSADEGYLQSQFKLAYIYEHGDGVKVNYPKAEHYYKLASAQGHAIAQYNLALMYVQAIGVVKDYKEAFNLFEKSASQGFAKAQYNLGLMYYYEMGVEKDLEKAYFWLLLSSANGYDEGQEIISYIEKMLNKNQLLKIQAKAKNSYEVIQ